MIIRGLDSDGEWLFGKGVQDYARNKEAIVLNVKTRLKSWVNDCFFDQEAGIDWGNRLGNNGQREFLETDIQNVIVNSFGVTGISDFNSNLDDRKLTVNYTITTIEGDVVDSLGIFDEKEITTGVIVAGDAFTNSWEATIISNDNNTNYIYSGK